ncbi:P-loop containing nucleoside triphosphate hydrolase protein [Phyllosticta paracitricarpa]|uniref:RNA helicase n=1 Tax=Phyllosticta paracitricarpa TaxID=2016321 RepID=A0ABR1NJF7_9PEZI
MATSGFPMPGAWPSSPSTEAAVELCSEGFNEISVSPSQAMEQSDDITQRLSPTQEEATARNTVSTGRPRAAHAYTSHSVAEAAQVTREQPQAGHVSPDWAAFRFPRFLLDNINRLEIENPSNAQKELLRAVDTGRSNFLVASEPSIDRSIGVCMSALSFAHKRHNRAGRIETCRPVPTVIILCPSQEKAARVYGILKALALKGPISTAMAIGGTSWGAQREQLQAGCDVLVGTPGRLVEIVFEGGHPIMDTDLLIMDGVRTLLGDLFTRQIKSLWDHDVFGDNTLFTFVCDRYSDDLEAEVLDFLPAEESFLVSTRASPLDLTPMGRINMTFHGKPRPTTDFETSRKIFGVINNISGKVIIFTNNSAQVDDLQSLLRGIQGLVVLRGSPRAQSEYEEACRACENGNTIITTDSAAKGITIPGVECVIHAHLPPPASNLEYSPPLVRLIKRIHRIAQSEFAGSSVAFYSQRVQHLFIKLAHHLVRSGQQEETRSALLNRLRQGESITPVHPAPAPSSSNSRSNGGA